MHQCPVANLIVIILPAASTLTVTPPYQMYIFKRLLAVLFKFGSLFTYTNFQVKHKVKILCCVRCRVMYLLGYIPKDNRVYLGDKELNVVSYSLLLSVLEYQTAVMRRDFETADKVLPMVPREQRTRVAHFLDKQVGFVVL
jgi:Coatomer WD associated region